MDLLTVFPVSRDKPVQNVAHASCLLTSEGIHDVRLSLPSACNAPLAFLFVIILQPWILCLFETPVLIQSKNLVKYILFLLQGDEQLQQTKSNLVI